MNFENLPVRASGPYPELTDTYDDKNTVRALKNLASSNDGELLASLQYSYQSVISDALLPEVADVLEEISNIKNIVKSFNDIQM